MSRRDDRRVTRRVEGPQLEVRDENVLLLLEMVRDGVGHEGAETDRRPAGRRRRRRVGPRQQRPHALRPVSDSRSCLLRDVIVERGRLDPGLGGRSRVIAA